MKYDPIAFAARLRRLTLRQRAYVEIIRTADSVEIISLAMKRHGRIELQRIFLMDIRNLIKFGASAPTGALPCQPLRLAA